MAVIVKASQRSNGSELARHLQNEADNEYVEFYRLRGAVSDDLDGSFAEWKAHAGVTKCKKELYSVSINPKEEWSREWYMEFIAQLEAKLGLENQPRAIVFHIKEGREHAHVVYSRIDIENEKAIHMAFDHDKIKMVVKEFAREKGLKLPEGYYKDKRQHDGKGQLLLHEKAQQDLTGITKEQRQEIITDIWRRSDTPHAFLAGLQDSGFMLCNGRRDLILVDYYGGTNALRRTITDKEVTIDKLRKFLEPAIDIKDLPDVEEMRKLIGKHAIQEEQFKSNLAQDERREQTKRLHEERRQSLQTELARLQLNHEKDLEKIKALHFGQRSNQRSVYLSQKAELTQKRQQHFKQGLPALLAKATGINILRRSFHQYKDRKTYQEFNQKKAVLHEQQREFEKRALHEQELVEREIRVRLNSLDHREKEELRALDKKEIKEHRIKKRQWKEQVPNLNFVLSPYKFRKPNEMKAKGKFNSEMSKKLRRAEIADKENQKQSDIGQTKNRSKARTMPRSGGKDSGKKR